MKKKDLKKKSKISLFWILLPDVNIVEVSLQATTKRDQELLGRYKRLVYLLPLESILK